ncbi:MAG TPA: twin transmembrane helix small protein [Coxiellaceae bacterium]|nr:twin transmembrane helix small protein [Coxiellaceae bacterium]
MLVIIVILFMLVILYCLGSAGFYLVRKGGRDIQLAKALTWRIVLSLLLFALMVLTFYMGWVQPHFSMG